MYFGQLLGMADHLSFTLGRAGYRIHKIVPYGPVHETLQYLIRHAPACFALTSPFLRIERLHRGSRRRSQKAFSSSLSLMLSCVVSRAVRAVLRELHSRNKVQILLCIAYNRNIGLSWSRV